MSNYYIDPNWCFENPNEAAAELERLHKWCDQLEKEATSYRGQAEKYATERDQLVQLVDMLLEGVALNKRLFIALREAATTTNEHDFLARAVTANTQLLAAGRLGKSAAVGGTQV